VMVEGNTGEIKGWGKENYPYPSGEAFIECDEMKCVGCDICQMACSMHHFGVINKNLARIQIRRYLLPVAKAIPVTCSQCPEGERECQKLCPLDPPAIHYDKKSFHMVVDQDRCLGNNCLQCQESCPAKAIIDYPSVSAVPLVCDLCDSDNTGQRDPQCVNVCPAGALYYKNLINFGYPIRDFMRKHADEKAMLIAKRLYPLPPEKMWAPDWEPRNE
jgi:anaerobic carbon-monoxide dehydrogenase iron sulfur subunit